MAQTTETKTATTATAVADPAPLGIFSFATTTLVLSASLAQFTGVGLSTALALALFVGGLAQLLAGMWEFKNGNTFGAVAFSSYAVFWMSYWAFFHLESQLPKAFMGANDVAWYLLGWTIVTGILFLATLRLNVGLMVVLALLFITLVLLTIGAFNPPAAGSQPSPFGGYFGIATAIAGYYVGTAGLLKAVGGIKLPVGGPLMKG
jgi:succinate-acetate transporter protein